MAEKPEDQTFLGAFDAYADALFRHACFRLSDRERAHDIVQDAFLKAWDFVAGGGTIREHRSFLYRIVNNLIVDEYRRKRPRSLDELLEDETTKAYIETQLSSGGAAETEEAFDAQERIAQLPRQIAQLPETYRHVLTLRFIDDLTLRDIAKILDVSENVVAVRIHRGIAKLKTFYAYE